MKRPAKSNKQKYREFLFKSNGKIFLNITLKIIMSHHKIYGPDYTEDLANVTLDKRHMNSSK